MLAAAAHGHHHDAPTDTLQQEALAASPGCCRMITLVAMRTGWGPMVEQMHTRAGRLQRSQIVRRPLMCSVCWVFMSSATMLRLARPHASHEHGIASANEKAV